MRLALSAYGDFDDLAPDAYLRVAGAEDGALFPFGERGGEWRGVGVAGVGVEDERDPALAAIHLDVNDVEVCAEALPAPVDEYAGVDDFCGDVRLQSGEGRAGLLGTNDAEVQADDFCVADGVFDVGDEGSESVPAVYSFGKTITPVVRVTAVVLEGEDTKVVGKNPVVD